MNSIYKFTSAQQERKEKKNRTCKYPNVMKGHVYELCAADIAGG